MSMVVNYLLSIFICVIYVLFKKKRQSINNNIMETAVCDYFVVLLWREKLKFL